jgi:hypothetical protein
MCSEASPAGRGLANGGKATAEYVPTFSEEGRSIKTWRMPWSKVESRSFDLPEGVNLQLLHENFVFSV